MEGAVEPGRWCRAAPTTDDPEHMSSTALLYSQGSPTKSSEPSFQQFFPFKRSSTVFLTALRSLVHQHSPLRTLYLFTPLCSQHHLWAENWGWYLGEDSLYTCCKWNPDPQPWPWLKWTIGKVLICADFFLILHFKLVSCCLFKCSLMYSWAPSWICLQDYIELWWGVGGIETMVSKQRRQKDSLPWHLGCSQILQCSSSWLRALCLDCIMFIHSMAIFDG